MDMYVCARGACGTVLRRHHCSCCVHMRSYRRVHTFLLQLRRLAHEVREVWTLLKVRPVAPRRARDVEWVCDLRC